MVETAAVPILRDVTQGMNDERARWLVDLYYSMQHYRIQADGQVRSAAQGVDEREEFGAGVWLSERFRAMEDEVKKALGQYADEHVPGVWAQTITGIGPVIAAGLLAHIDITRSRTAGSIWRFAGLDPTSKWKKGEKRPWNADLKVLTWKIGDSFVKNRNRDSDIYGHVYWERKLQEIARNDAGLFADQARESLETRSIRDPELRACYESGKLPPGRLDLRARRYATKLFLAHYHHVAYEDHYGEPPPLPYILENPSADPTGAPHTTFLAPPNWPL